MESSGTNRRVLLSGLFAVFLLHTFGAILVAAQAQAPGHDLAELLRGNVVAIEARQTDGTIKDGFGFITGTLEGEFYIATANHVLRGQGRDEVAEKISVQLYERGGDKFEATLLDQHDGQIDVGAIRAKLPPGISWNKFALAEDPDKLQGQPDVWFVGLDGEWKVPARPGAIYQIRQHRREILIDGLDIKPGTSGAPLIADIGIVGMILEDEDVSARAISIDAVKAAFSEWRLPWELQPAPTVWMGPFCKHYHQWASSGTTGVDNTSSCTKSKLTLGVDREVFCEHNHKFALNWTTYPNDSGSANAPGSAKWCNENHDGKQPVPGKTYKNHQHHNAGTLTTGPIPTD